MGGRVGAMTMKENGKGRFHPFPQWLALVAVAVAAVAALLAGARGSDAQSSSMIGIDVIPDTNRPASLGELETCASAESGDVFAVDVFINNVDALTKWEARVEYDSDVLSLEEVDYNQFLVSTGGSVFPSLFDSESEGRYFLAAAEVQTAPDSGSGTLARLTMRAVDEGRTTVRVVSTPGYLGPQLSGVGGVPVGDSTGDAIWDGDYLEGDVVVDGDCDVDSPVVTPKPDPGPAPQPTRSPGRGGNGGGGNGGSGGSNGGSSTVTSEEQVVLISEDGELLVDSSDDSELSEDGGDDGDSSESSSEDGSSNAGGVAGEGDAGGGGGSESGEEERLGTGTSPTVSGGEDTGWIILGFGAAAALVIAGGGLYVFARRRL
jgi:Cohesin domain